MNWKIKSWFWTQYLVVLGFVVIIVIMQLHPWYYSLSYITEEQEEGAEEQVLNFRQTMIQQAGTNKIGKTQEQLGGEEKTELEMRYANGAKLSSLDLLIIFGYMLSISYVLGMFLTSAKSAILVNMPTAILMIIKSVWIMQGIKTYKLAIKNVMIWWLCLVVYLILFLIHNKIIVTEVEREVQTDGIGIAG